MSNKYVLQKLIDWLNSLEDSELQQISNLFSEGEVRESLLALIGRVIALRKFEKRRTPQPHFGPKAFPNNKSKTEIRRTETVGEQTKVEHALDLKKAFYEIFENNNAFPSRKDMLEEMNKIFNCNIEYNQNSKKGRTDLISKCWNKVKDTPSDDLRKKLGNLIGRFHYSPHNDQYKELFRILANHE